MGFKLSAINSQNIKKGINYIKDNGVSGLASRVRYKMSGPGLSYVGWYKEKHEANQETLMAQLETEFAYEPLISILVPVYNTKETYLRDMIESVKNQTYGNWQLIIVDGSERVNDEEPVTTSVIREYADVDERIICIALEENLGISDNTNQALERATGDYIALLDHDDMYTADALFCIVNALQEEKYDVLYSDEDKISDDGKRVSDPAFKPDFSMDLLRAHNYITHLFVAKRSLVNAVYGFAKEYDGAQDYDLILKCCERTNSIKHISRVLYHWRINKTSVAAGAENKDYANEAGKRALSAHLQRQKVFGVAGFTDMWGIYKVTYDTPGNPLLSIVVLGGEDRELAAKCIYPLFENARYSNFEVIIVDPYSDNRDMQRFYSKLQSIRSNVKVVSYEGMLTKNAMRNFGASYVKGDYVLFLDYNMEIIDVTALGEMLGHCIRDEIGIVGGMLYNDSNVTESGGIVLGLNGLYSHLYKGIKKGDFGYLMHNKVNCNYSAVSGSGMMVKTELFRKLGGFSDKFKSELSDIDFCLRVRERNKLIVCVADAGWYVHRTLGKTLGFDSQAQGHEKGLFEILWGQLLAEGDPYYNINFTREGNDHSL